METQQETWDTEEIARAICRSYTGEIDDETLAVREPEGAQRIGNIATGVCYAA